MGYPMASQSMAIQTMPQNRIKRPRGMNLTQLADWLLEHSTEQPGPLQVFSPCKVSHLSTDGWGYACVGHKGRVERAHRMVYMAFKGQPDADRPIIRHTCDVPNCVNPAHLLSGTVADNNDDKIRRGRANMPHGETHAKARLSDFEVRRIREEYAQGGVSGPELAERYGTSKATVNRLLHGDTRRSAGGLLTPDQLRSVAEANHRDLSHRYRRGR